MLNMEQNDLMSVLPTSRFNSASSCDSFPSIASEKVLELYNSIPEEYRIENVDIVNKVGEGSYGAVYKIKMNDKFYALKISKLTYNLYINFITLREIVNVSLLKQIKTNHIVQYLKIGFLIYEESLCVGIIMEYCGKGSLYDKTCKTINDEKLNDIIDTVGLLHSHGLYHGDLSTRNILCSQKMYKLCDFGFCRRVYRLLDDYLLPTPIFAPPKKSLEYEKLMCQKIDLWSLGCIVYLTFTCNYYYPNHYRGINGLDCDKSVKKFLLNALNPNQLLRAPLDYTPERYNIKIPNFQLDYIHVNSIFKCAWDFGLEDEVIYSTLIQLTKLQTVTSHNCAAMLCIIDSIISQLPYDEKSYTNHFGITYDILSKEILNVLTTLDFDLDNHSLWNYVQYYDENIIKYYECILFLVLLSNYAVDMDANDITTTIYKFFVFYHSYKSPIMNNRIIIQKPTIIGSSKFGFKWVDHIKNMFDHIVKFIENNNEIMQIFRLYYKKMKKEHIINWVHDTKKYM